MTDVTVKQLADSVGTPVDRLLSHMKEAGLTHKKEDEVVSEEQKKTLLEFLTSLHRNKSDGGNKITLKRKSLGTLKSGQGRTGRNVTVEVRRKRTYVKQGSTQTEPEDVSIPEKIPAVSQSELEAQRIRDLEEARAKAEEQTRVELEKKKDIAKEKAEKVAKAEQEEAKVDSTKHKTKNEGINKKNKEKAGVTAADLQAKEISAGRSGKKGRSKEKESAENTKDIDSLDRRRELSLKSTRKSRKRAVSVREGPLKVDQQGGEFQPTEFISREVEIGEFVSVGELAQRMAVKAGEVIKVLMNLGVIATINQTIDTDTATLVVEELGHKVKLISEDALEEQLEASLVIEGNAEKRAPVVTIMGHVDHGKTSLLDYIRKTRVTSGEEGGITQHIGAYSVVRDDESITFIDTPGHAAFSAMRARGARVTDIVVLVVAADDGVMPQTLEAIQHSKAAEVPIIVAINKIDLEASDPEKVTNELSANEVIPEEWGGDTQFVKVSAVSGEGIDALLEAIVLQAELLELNAMREAPAQGVVIESRLDKGRGPVATVLIQNGRLEQGNVVLAGEFFGRVRAMLDHLGEPQRAVGPSTAIELLGLNGTPEAGDEFAVAVDEKAARELAEFRKGKSQERLQAIQQASKLENIFAGIDDGKKRVLNVVIKADVRGSLEAIVQAIADLGNEEVAVKVLGSGVGGISESDVTMAATYEAAIFGFNVRADSRAKALLEKDGIEARYYGVIYELLDDLKVALSGMLAPEIREEIVGIAEVRDVFNSPRFGQVAGCMVTEGSVFRSKPIRVLRDNIVIYEGELESLRRFKDDVNEVRNGTECGIGVRNYNDVKSGDLIEVYDSKEVARALQ